MSVPVVVITIGSVLMLSSLAWWVSIERRKDQARAAGYAALDANDGPGVRSALADHESLVKAQRWPNWLGRMTVIGVGVFIGRYLALGGSW